MARMLTSSHTRVLAPLAGLACSRAREARGLARLAWLAGSRVRGARGIRVLAGLACSLARVLATRMLVCVCARCSVWQACRIACSWARGLAGSPGSRASRARGLRVLACSHAARVLAGLGLAGSPDRVLACLLGSPPPRAGVLAGLAAARPPYNTKQKIASV